VPRLSEIKEAVPVVPDDDTGWRSYGTQPPIADNTIERIQKDVKEAYYSNPLVHMAVDTLVEYILGEKVECIFARPSPVGASFWEQEVAPELEESLRELLTSGELTWLINREQEGLPTYAAYDSTRVIAYEVLADNQRRVSKLKINEYGSSTEVVYPLVGYAESGEGKAIAWLPVNRFGDGIRGVPTISHTIDTANVFDRSNIAMLARLPGLYAIWWDVTLKGFTPNKVREWEEQYGGFMPEPGSIIAHNDSSIWDIKSAAGAARTSSDWNAYFRDFILSASGVSPTIFSGTSYRYSESSDPMTRFTKRLRAKYEVFLSRAVAFAAKIPFEAVKVIIIPPTSADLLRIASAVERVSNALNTAMASGWLSPERAASIFNQVATELGNKGEAGAKNARGKNA